MKGILKKDSQINSDSRCGSFLRQEDNTKERLRKEAQNIKMEVKINFHAKPARTHAQKMLNAISNDVLHTSQGARSSQSPSSIVKQVSPLPACSSYVVPHGEGIA